MPLKNFLKQNTNMKNKLLLFILAGVLLSFIPNPEKEYSAKLSVSEWNILILSVNSPDDVTNNQKKAVLSKLIPQIQNQIISDTIPKKK